MVEDEGEVEGETTGVMMGGWENMVVVGDMQMRERRDPVLGSVISGETR